MSSEPFPRALIRKLEGDAFPLSALEGIRELRDYLERAERRSLDEARAMGASPSDIAQALGITRQGVYHKIKRLEHAAVVETDDVEPVVILDLERERSLTRGEPASG